MSWAHTTQASIEKAFARSVMTIGGSLIRVAGRLGAAELSHGRAGGWVLRTGARGSAVPLGNRPRSRRRSVNERDGRSGRPSDYGSIRPTPPQQAVGARLRKLSARLPP